MRCVFSVSFEGTDEQCRDMYALVAKARMPNARLVIEEKEGRNMPASIELRQPFDVDFYPPSDS